MRSATASPSASICVLFGPMVMPTGFGLGAMPTRSSVGLVYTLGRFCLLRMESPLNDQLLEYESMLAWTFPNELV